MLRVVSPASAPSEAAPLSRELPKSRSRAEQPTLVEVFDDSLADGGTTGFVMGQITGQGAALADKPLLWVQDRLTRREAGRPCLAGLRQAPVIIHVDVSKPVDVLWAMEEGLRCSDLCGVLGEVWGDPPILDFTATKRLALRAEATGVPAWLIRRAGHPNLSAARERWRVKSVPSLTHPFDARAPGPAQWQAELFRARWRTPGTWVTRQDGTALAFTPVATPTDPAPTAVQA